MKPGKTYDQLIKYYRDGFTDFGCKGSARAGKTVDINMFGLTVLAASARHRKMSTVSHSFPHLRQGAIYELEKILLRENITLQHNKGLHEFTLNKSTWDYFSLDTDGNKAVGPGRDIIHINEPNRGIGYTAYNDLRIRSAELAIMDWNPSGPWWLQEQNVFANNPKYIEIHATWLDNIRNLSQMQIDYFIRAKELSKTEEFWAYWWKVYGLGQDGILVTERIMPFLRHATTVPIDAVEIPSALDFGFYPHPTAMARLWIQRTRGLKDNLFIKKIVYDQRLSINAVGSDKNLADILVERRFDKKHMIIADSEDPRAINDLRAAKFNVIGINKMSVEISIRQFHDYNIYIVDEDDGKQDAWTEFDLYKYKVDKKTGKPMGVPEKDQPDHLIDGVRYVLMCKDLRWTLPKLKVTQV